MTGQSLLDRMEVLNAELQLQPGEADVTKGLVALNVAQDYFESLAAARGKLFADQGPSTLSTAASTEYTAFPSSLLRLDRMQRLDSGNPVAEVTPIRRTGGHAGAWFWPWNVVASTSSGVPSAYWTEGRNIFWTPVPDAIYSIRYYGFSAAADITASGTFTYPDSCALPLAAFAAGLIKTGLDDDASALSQLSQSTFGPVLDQLANVVRDGARGFEYTEVHET